MVLPFQRIFEPRPPAACTPLRRIAPFEPMVHTAPEVSTICAAVVGTIVPSGEVLPPLLPGTVGPTLFQPDPIHCHQFASIPRTLIVLAFQRICEPRPPAADDPFRRIATPEPIDHKH